MKRREFIKRSVLTAASTGTLLDKAWTANHGLLDSPGDTHSKHLPQDKLELLELDQVKAGGELGRRIELTLRKNIFALDIEKDFLRPFRQRGRMGQVEGFSRFVGLGHLIDAVSQFGKATGDPEVIKLKDYLVAEVIRTQSPSGYIGIVVEEPDARQLWWEYAFHEASFMAHGLSQNYRYFHESASLGAARKLIDYLIVNWPKRPEGNYFTTLGLEEACFSLYDLTREKKYLRFAIEEPMGRRYEITPGPLISWQQELHPPTPLNPQQISDQPQMAREFDYVHLYRTFSRAIMQLQLYRMEPRENLLVTSRRLVAGMVRPTKPGILITGAIGHHEAWNENQWGLARTGETCATVYELWLLDELLRMDGDLRYGDIMERAIHNALFGAQEPQGRRICYFIPFSQKRQYFERDGYCCPNNFRRGAPSLPKLIYYRSKDGVAVNLYTTSTAKFELAKGNVLELRQETEYPTSNRVVIKVTPSQAADFKLRLRMPRWCKEPKVAVNGKAVTQAKATDALEISREWQGDQVTLEFPMAWRWIKGKEIQEGRAALMRGPLVYGLNPARNPSALGLTLRDITMDPDSVEGPTQDGSVRPNGTSVRIKAWSPRRQWSQPADLDLVLTEFVDPGTEEIYFRLPDLNRAGEDDLTSLV